MDNFYLFKSLNIHNCIIRERKDPATKKVKRVSPEGKVKKLSGTKPKKTKAAISIKKGKVKVAAPQKKVSGTKPKETKAAIPTKKGKVAAPLKKKAAAAPKKK